MSIIHLKWGRERLRIALPSSDFSQVTLQSLQDAIVDQTGLTAGRFKLIYGGAVMKNEKYALSAFGIKPGATLVLMGTVGQADAGEASTSSQNAEEVPSRSGAKEQEGKTAVLERIAHEMQSVRTTLSSEADSFLADLQIDPAAASEPTSNSSPPALLQQTHARLSELLLQSLLRLDAIIPSSYTDDSEGEVRNARRAAVKEVQQLLDRVDDGWQASVQRRT